jgi:AIR synthase-related protein
MTSDPALLHSLVASLRQSRGFAHKRDIAEVLRRLGAALPGGLAQPNAVVAVGDDCAVLTEPGSNAEAGHLLFAIEGLVNDFVAAQPWFAGYSAVMVNLSDIYAMGGRPLAVVNALWSAGPQQAEALLAGMAAAASRYGVPIVGGHSNLRNERPQLAVAVLGRARRLISSFAARPGDALLMAVDLRGAWQDPFPFWNASTTAPAARLREGLGLLPALAEEGLVDAGKDISMAGALGTALMLLECSGVGARLRLDDMPRPAQVNDHAGWLRWLSAFPSYGFLLSVRPQHVAVVQQCFLQRGLDCACIGDVQAGPEVTLGWQGEQARLWDFGLDGAFIGAGPAAVREPAHG